ncbi:hypothetical protein P7K49_032681 [Saguinus oedipus]|uniref:Ig-like domain-containing protein n=1 Tax=Saguinus oedipus TaxID=9490 RepID=A0ABQ9TPR6_SAGOE|nr:hypothetical protein P7K49_032681 [Saguinus oedipus]
MGPPRQSPLPLWALGFDFLSSSPDLSAGFVRAPLSQQRRVGGRVELHCEAVGSPVPEIQWWFEGHGPNDTCSQLWDGARLDRVHIHATYRQHAASTISIDMLAEEDSGTYECRASNDPDRNHLTRAPRVKWVRAQAVVLVLERASLGGAAGLPALARGSPAASKGTFRRCSQTFPSGCQGHSVVSELKTSRSGRSCGFLGVRQAARTVLLHSADCVSLGLTAGAVSTSVENIGSKTLLTCSLNDNVTEVTGHRWLKGDVVLQEDSQPGQKMSLE